MKLKFKLHGYLPHPLAPKRRGYNIAHINGPLVVSSFGEYMGWLNEELSKEHENGLRLWVRYKVTKL